MRVCPVRDITHVTKMIQLRMRTDDSLLTLTISAINVIGANLSEPHTNGTALQDACVYVCLRTYVVRPYTENLN